MNRNMAVGVVLAVMVVSLGASAELQNVQVGGSLRIRGLIQSGLIPANDNVVEQRTRLNMKGDFTENVSAFIEFDDYGKWGDGFRSDYLTGVDMRPNGADKVNVYQAYIDVKEIGGTPLSLRAGRQEIVLGSGWLIGNNEDKLAFTGLSFDALHLTYVTEKLTAGAFYARLAAGSPEDAHGNADLYTAYVNYTQSESFALLGYWILVHDPLNPAPGYDATNLHTVGLRANGAVGAFDYDAELAYQFGNADRVGIDFDDPHASFDNLAGTVEVGYTFDCPWKPKVSLGAVYFGGEDRRDDAKCREPNHASVSFNRLFSDLEYCYLDSTELSNCWMGHGGVEIAPADKLSGSLTLCHIQAVDNGEIGSSDLGWETGLLATYEYTKDLSFEAAWYHWFRGDGAKEGNYVVSNGLDSTAGLFKDHVDYMYLEAKVTF
ncbi:MAG: alginate export family protein [Candidatus Hydrogenedentes bacterium]|nr:alginate export family protein [Candidatus Hydrogenedentota bacterium]